MTQIILLDAQRGHVELMHLWSSYLKPHLLSGHQMMVDAKRMTRTLEQNRKFHAICGDYARAKAEWAGKPRDSAAWKVLLISGHAFATKAGVEIIPGLEGEFVNIRESSALMSVARSSSLIEYSSAHAVHMGVTLREA